MKKLKKTFTYILLLALLLQTLCGCALLDGLNKTRVQWRDAAVGQAAAQALGKRVGAVVYFEELEEITHIEISGVTQVDLTDLSGLPNLTSVDVSGANVADYTPLLYCTKLEVLRVGDADYEAHAAVLQKLQETVADTDIDVDGKYYATIAAVFHDPAIEQAVRDIAAKPEGELTLADTRHIRELELQDLEACDLSDLKYLIELRELTMTGCNIDSLEAVYELPNLLYLNVENNNITDLSGIEKLSALQVLIISGNPVGDISPLVELENLFALSAQNCALEDVTPVSQMQSLTNLSLTNCGIEDVAFLSDCTNLSVLWLDENSITDISPLVGLTNLTVLGLSSNRLEDISPLAELTNLEYLYLANNNITDISVIGGMEKLCGLQLTMNNIFDISPLAELENLTELSILSNPIVDYTPIMQEDRVWDEIDVDPELAQQGVSAAQAIASDIRRQGLSGGKAVGAAHDAVIRTARYDHNAANEGKLGFNVQSTYSALVREKTVCVGYAEALTVILRLLDMEAYVVSGTAGGVEHAWVLLIIDDMAYYIDPTWDDPDEGILIYRDFLMVSEEKLDETHDWDIELFLPDAA